MNEREFLVNAQEADALANAATSQRLRQQWEAIAAEYRKLAKLEVVRRQIKRTNPA